MDDREIIELLFRRTESALDEISRKYSHLYMGIIKALINDSRDAEECANDVLLAVWNSIPPNKPDHLSAYVCKLARRIGIDRFRHNTVGKRNGTYVLALDELEECLPSDNPFGAQSEKNEIIRSVLSDFIRGLDPETEILFVRRYIYLESVMSLAERFGLEENRVSVKLSRARKKLKKLLEKEGIRI
jgi:RNA polymerase sigma-70 factor (ECF subfamily)